MPFRTEGWGNMTLLKEMHSKSWAHLKRKREKRKLFIVQTHEKKKKTSNKCTRGKNAALSFLKCNPQLEC